MQTAVAARLIQFNRSSCETFSVLPAKLTSIVDSQAESVFRDSAENAGREVKANRTKAPLKVTSTNGKGNFKTDLLTFFASASLLLY